MKNLRNLLKKYKDYTDIKIGKTGNTWKLEPIGKKVGKNLNIFGAVETGNWKPSPAGGTRRAADAGAMLRWDVFMELAN